MPNSFKFNLITEREREKLFAFLVAALGGGNLLFDVFNYLFNFYFFILFPSETSLDGQCC